MPMRLFRRTSERRSISAAAADRRAYPRVQAPIAMRPVGFIGKVLARPVNDVSRGGLRAYSDEIQRVGERHELELFLPTGPSVVVVAQVVWVEELPEGSPARFDVGMRYVEVRTEDLDRIAEFFPKE